MAVSFVTTSPEEEDKPKLGLGNIQTPLIFNPSMLNLQANIPNQFIWPDDEKPSINVLELDVPLIDLQNLLSDPSSTLDASRLISEACKKHGFFLVVNHGISEELISDAHEYTSRFFDMPLSEKQRVLRKSGESVGYASSFTGDPFFPVLRRHEPLKIRSRLLLRCVGTWVSAIWVKVKTELII
uniref:GA20ox1 n=1 Tax=Arabidopsis thaliana TaxID=3702 RepID=U3MZJ1_ARATH|nr:GA20ox1 [Arabidopsis thaliana]